MAGQPPLDLACEKPTLPLLKWPGGKRALAPEIIKLFPPKFGRYFEPFCGGAAVFFHLGKSPATLIDINSELIRAYRTVVEQKDELLALLKSYPNNAEFYYQLRQTRSSDDLTMSARFIYLTKLSFNGIYRVNLKGQFNVPYGGRSWLRVVDELAYTAAAAALSTAELVCGDFEIVTDLATPGDLVYFDPPYTVAHSNNGFVKYNDRLFQWTDQVKLAEVALRLMSDGVTVIVSMPATIRSGSSIRTSMRSKFTGIRPLLQTGHAEAEYLNQFL